MTLKIEGPKWPRRTWINLFVRLLQLIGAIIICVYYGRVLEKAMRRNVYGDARWIFATTVGALSGATALVYMIWGAALEFRTIAILFVWDLIIFVQWVILSGLFGYMYIGENAEMDDGIQKMKTACYFDIVNMVLWMASAGYCGWVVFVADRNALSEGKKKEASSEEAGKKAAPQS